MNKTYERRWLRFAKVEKMKYIGHLDLQTIFHGAIRRAKLPIAYSQGFNPHQRISFALPLPVGMESLCEYVELVLEEPADVALLDEHLPSGLRILDTYEVPEKAPRPAAEVAAVDYRLTGINADKAYDQIVNRTEIVVLKKTKSGEKEVDIKPLIKEISYSTETNRVVLNTLLACGSRENLSASLLSDYIKEKVESIEEDSFVDIERIDMYAYKEKKILPLNQYL